MRRFGILAVAVAVVAVLAVLQRDARKRHRDTEQGGPGAVAVASAVDRDSPRPVRDQAAADESTRVPVADDAVELVGCCVADDGAPLPDAHLSVHASRLGPVATQSDGAGRFVLRVWPVAGIEVHLVVRHRAHLDLERRWPDLGAKRRLDLGDLRLRPGCVVSGVVRELDGRPVGGLALRAVPDGEWASEPRHAVATSAADGVFAFDAALAPGRWVVRADPREFVVPAVFAVGDEPGRRFDWSLAAHREPRRITGVVVDADDHRIDGVVVAVVEPLGVAPVTSASDGSFRLLDWAGQGDAAQVVLQPTDGDPPDPATRIAWGSHDVQLVWRRGATLRVRLRGEHLDATCAAIRLPVQDVHGPFLEGEHGKFERGVCELPAMRSGRYAVWAAGHACETRPAVVSLGGQRIVEITLDPVALVERVVQVRQHDGSPAPLVQVAWVPDEPGVSHVVTRLAHRQFQTLHLTGADGNVRFSGLAGQPGRLVLRVGDGPEVVREGVVFAPEPWREELPAGATVAVVGTRGAERADQGVLRLRGSAGALFPPPRGSSRMIDLPRANAWWLPRWPTFTCVPPGDWQIELHRRGRISVLGHVRDLAVGETRRVEVALPEPDEVRVIGTLRWNGRAYPQGVRLVPQDLDGAFLAETGDSVEVHLPSPAGRIEGCVPAGRYRAYLGRQPIAGDLDLRAGAAARVDLHLETRSVRIRVLRGGLPWPGVELRVVLQTGDRLTCPPTDDYGVTELAMPYGAHVCSRIEPAGEVALGSLTVVRGDGPLPVGFAQ